MHLRREQLFRYRKYASLTLPHLTPRKVVNALRVERRFRTGNADMSGVYPYILFVDPYTVCNLQCPLCVMGRRKLRRREPLMTPDAYRRIVGPLAPYLFQVFLYNNSEPFLNPGLTDIIRQNRAWNVGSVISSNLSVELDPADVVASGLEYLIVSADGLSQDVYGQYRIGGSLDLVMENLRGIIAEKRRRGTRRPLIEWQCLVTAKNEHQLDDIRRTAYETGVDVVRFANINFYSNLDNREDMERTWLPENPSYRAFASDSGNDAGEDHSTQRRTPCFWLWRTAVINADGSVMPCCLYDTEGWGNAFDTPFTDIWRNGIYNRARQLSDADTPDGLPTVCDTCTADFIYR